MTQEQLKAYAIACSDKIRNAKLGAEYFKEPYKHCVIDNFFTQEIANNCYYAFPELTSPVWDQANDPDIEVKYRTKWQSEFDVPEGISPVVRIMNSSFFLKVMAELLEIPKLIPDPYFSGGGLNVTVSGVLLDVHVDGNYHDATGLNRRINAILYLNPNWEISWGGEFGLYDQTEEKLIKKIEPLYNRLVIFDTNDYSYHGLPDPLNFPEGHARRSVILYYYTKDSRPASQESVEAPFSAMAQRG